MGIIWTEELTRRRAAFFRGRTWVQLDAFASKLARDASCGNPDAIASADNFEEVVRRLIEERQETFYEERRNQLP